MTTTMATTDDRAAREQDLATALGPPGGRLLRGDPLPDLLLPVPG